MKRLIKAIIMLVFAVAIPTVLMDLWVVQSTHSDISVVTAESEVALPEDKLNTLAGEHADCILVLGAGVRPDGMPTHMLQDRLDAGIYLYKQGVSQKLLFSGDNGQVEYNEVECMKKYALAHGVAKENIFLDHAGFSTYESIYRSRDVFECNSVIIVTQKYHEYRALYIAERLELDATGVAARDIRYRGQAARDIREIVARDKDFLKCVFKPLPKYLGDAIPVSGDGQITW